MRYRLTPLARELQAVSEEDRDKRLAALWKEFAASSHFWLVAEVLRSIEAQALNQIRAKPHVGQVENAVTLHVIETIRRVFEGCTAGLESPPVVDWYDDESFVAEEETND